MLWSIIVGGLIGLIAGAITKKGGSMGLIANIIAGRKLGTFIGWNGYYSVNRRCSDCCCSCFISIW